jgi:endonuclease YncB( thermonuclease family)
LTEVARYTHSGGKSANFVKVSNGYIFVAYGRSGLQVFKLNKI